MLAKATIASTRNRSQTMHPNIALRGLAAAFLPSMTEVEAARGHFRTVAARLDHSFGVKRCIPIGSHARGTAIRIYSDIDMLVALPRKQSRRGNHFIAPQAFLRKVANDLQDRYTQTSVRRDGQAVVLGFRDGTHSVDVVPGIFVRMNGVRPLYAIPGSADKWIGTSPETHDLMFKKANARSGGKLGAVSRLIKGWRHSRRRTIPISSFYTDLLLATTDVAAGVKPYSECLYDFFNEIVRRNARGLRDPAGIAGVIYPAKSERARDRVFDAANYALDHAASALDAENRGKHSKAVEQWEIIFNRSLYV